MLDDYLRQSDDVYSATQNSGIIHSLGNIYKCSNFVTLPGVTCRG
jgi:hypothetical protein